VSTIGAALDTACAGDTIIVASGTYHEYNLEMKPGVVLLGETGLASDVTIDADSLGRVMRCELLDGATVIRGFTFEDGFADSGGAILCLSASPTISNCDFYDCHAAEAGGALYCHASSPEVTGCRVLQSTAQWGAGGYLTSGSSTYLRDCTFSENLASLEGGGLYMSLSSSARLDTCRFIENSADSAGGAIYSYDCSVVADSCLIFRNSAYYGAGVWTTRAASDTFTTCHFESPFPPTMSSGGVILADSGSVALIGCQLYYNASGFDLSSIRTTNTNLVLSNCNVQSSFPLILVDNPRTVLDSCYFDGVARVSSHNSPTVMTDCYFDRVDDDYDPTVAFTGTSSDTLIDCTFYWCGAYDGYGTVFVDGPSLYMRGCRFIEGMAYYGGAVYFSGPVIELTRCMFFSNDALEGGGVYLNHQTAAVVDSCTFHYNSGYGGGLYCAGSPAPVVSNTIIAFSRWVSEAVACAGSACPVFTCCNIYGNGGGDWTGDIAGQEGINGNFSSDPRFCDPAGGDLRLRSSSPCVSRPGCGQIGAYGLGCHDEAPYITTVSDVDNDQGRWLRLVWRRSAYDAPAESISVLGYAVYRRQDDFLAMGGGAQHVVPKLSSFPGAPLITGWDCVGYVPARGDSAYQLVSPTLCDSTDGGICWSVFMVSAATGDPTVYFDSEPDSGYSIDNLAPSPPPGLVMASAVDLDWNEVPDEDFDYYSVYGSDEPVLDGAAVLIGYTIDTAKDITGHVYEYYHVTATDFSGNEGEESSVNNTFAGVPDLPKVSEGSDIPEAFALRPCKPNPFSSTTSIAFDVPVAAHVSITIFDTRGRIIKRLSGDKYEAGHRAVTWRGEDETGASVSSGVYFVRMETGTFQDMKKVMLLR
jgi:predicted outer membrane repeat protein